MLHIKIKKNIFQRRNNVYPKRQKNSFRHNLRHLLHLLALPPHVKMLVRIKPIGDSSETYLQLLLASIEQEFQHNMVQQLYISDDCWNVVVTTKIAVINNLKKVSNASDSATDFRERVFLEYSKKAPATDTAVAFLKNEVKKII